MLINTNKIKPKNGLYWPSSYPIDLDLNISASVYDRVVVLSYRVDQAITQFQQLAFAFKGRLC